MEDLTRLVKTSLDRYIQISTQSGPSKVSYFAPLVEAFLGLLQVPIYAKLSWNLRLFGNRNEL